MRTTVTTREGELHLFSKCYFAPELQPLDGDKVEVEQFDGYVAVYLNDAWYCDATEDHYCATAEEVDHG